MYRNKRARRTAMSTSFDVLFNKISNSLDTNVFEITALETDFNLLKIKFEEIRAIDEAIMLSLDENAETTEEAYTAEITTQDIILNKFESIKVKVQPILQDESAKSVSSAKLQYSNRNHSQLKLPRLAPRKFDGDIKGWVTFWSHYEKIHLDEQIDVLQKLDYLYQSTVPESKARRIVESFPASAENYPKVIQALKERFGREDLLVEVYIRELLNLVLTKSKGLPLSTLYDQVQCQLRALDTLGVKTDLCAAMLFPLVESCLPEETLRAWQRFTSAGQDSTSLVQENRSGKRLLRLMEFLKKEVENEERVVIAMSGFGLGDNYTPATGYTWPYGENSSAPALVPSTSHGLANVNSAQPSTSYDSTPSRAGLACVFCYKFHSPNDCFKAQKMTYAEKTAVVKKLNFCIWCIAPKHTKGRCTYRGSCLMCKRRHMTVMCPGERKETSQPKDDSNIRFNVADTVRARNATPPPQVSKSHRYSQNRPQKKEVSLTNTSTTVLLQTVAVNLQNEGRPPKQVRALFDSGSSRSYILKSTAEELQYPTAREEVINHELFGGESLGDVHHQVYYLHLSDIYNEYFCGFEVLDHPVMCGYVPQIPDGPWRAELSKLNISLSDVARKPGPIELIIGSDVMGKLYTGEVRLLDCGLTLIGTKLGWVLTGKMTTGPGEPGVVLSMFNKDQKVSDLWSLDVLGIEAPQEKLTKQATHERTLKNFNDNTYVNEEGRYVVSMPWLEDHPPLPSNYNLALTHLDNTISKLKKSELFDAYNNILFSWLEEGIIEQVYCTDDAYRIGHYLPHRPVVKENSTTRVRPVFNASAKSRGAPSLNHCLDSGVNLIELIPITLLRFRLRRIGVIADIEKAFLQISLNPDERDFVRFLWVDSEGHVIIFRHCRAVFGLTCSPFWLGATLQTLLQEVKRRPNSYSTWVIEYLFKSFYVDNCTISIDSLAQAEVFRTQATQILQERAFVLRGWEVSGEPTSSPTNVLGIQWNKQQDTLNIQVPEATLYMTITKRVILSSAQKVFDPIGYTTPVTLIPKLLLQEVWKNQTSWDEEVEESVKERFEQWLSELPLLGQIKIDRWLNYQPNLSHISLHVFGDASALAYAAVIFLRTEIDHQVSVHLIEARARVAPTKGMTIPRLELLASTIAVRLYQSIVERCPELAGVSTYFWTDSTTTLAWIQRNNNWGVFVRNRVAEIQRYSKVEQWHHVPGTHNPADLPSRGCSARKLIELSWWEGPEWLYLPPTEWDFVSDEPDESIINSERLKSELTCFNNHDMVELGRLYTYFSSYNKLVRMIAWMLRFIAYARREDRRPPELSTEEVLQAEILLFRLVQKECFPQGIETKSLSSLQPFIDPETGLIRLKTRISRREDVLEFLYPVILPDKHTVTTLLIRDAHQKHCHVGTQGLLSILRERAWVIGGRRTVRMIVNKCVICKRFAAEPVQPESAVLPADRVRDCSSFEITGVDLAGPVLLRGGRKAWIVIYTCAVYRGVHLELITSLSTDAFLQAFRRFISRRGRPLTVYSDNGTNFVGTDNAFRSLDWKTILEYSSTQRIHWKFNPPTASWWGGWWERVVQMVKRLLRRVLAKAFLNYEEFNTILCDAEDVINKRPISYLSNDTLDCSPISPVMFLRDRQESGVTDIDAIERTALTRRLQYRQRLREDLRKRFRNEYLGLIVQKPNKRIHNPLQVGEVVFIGNDLDKRVDWPLGKVIAVFQGKDNVVRVARVKTARGEYLRPVQRLYRLEVEGKEDLTSTDLETCPMVKQVQDPSLESTQLELEESDSSEMEDCSSLNPSKRTNKQKSNPSSQQDYHVPVGLGDDTPLVTVVSGSSDEGPTQQGCHVPVGLGDDTPLVTVVSGSLNEGSSHSREQNVDILPTTVSFALEPCPNGEPEKRTTRGRKIKTPKRFLD